MAKKKVIKSAKEIQPLRPKQIKKTGLPSEIERVAEENPNWRLIGVKASDWGLAGTASNPKHIYFLPKVKGRRGKYASPGLRRQVIGVEKSRSVYKIPMYTTERHLDEEAKKLDKMLVDEMRALIKRVPRLKASRIDDKLKVAPSKKSEPLPVRIDVYEMVYPPKNLGEIQFPSKKDLLETVETISQWVSLLAMNDIIYDDIKLENFALNDKGLWIVDEEARIIETGQRGVRDLQSVGRGLGRLVLQIMKHPVHSKHKIDISELKKAVVKGVKEFNGSHANKILEGFNAQLKERKPKMKSPFR